MSWMAAWAGGFPVFFGRGARRPRHRRRRQRVRRLLPRRHGCDGRPRAAADGRAMRDQAAAGTTTMLPTEDAAWVGEELARRFGLPLLAVRADRDRREPLGAPARARGHRPAEGARLQLVLPRLGRRGVRDARRRRRARSRERQRRPAGRPGRDHEGRRVQRPRRARARRSRPATSPACSPSRRSRTSASSSPSPASTTACASSRAGRHAARDRRDAHAVRRARRLHARRRGSSPTSSRSASRSRAAIPPRRYGMSRAELADRVAARTDADLRGRRRRSAARSPATRSRSRRRGRRSSTSSPTRRTSA